MLYDIMPNTLRSTLDLENPKSNPHVDGIVGFSQKKSTGLATSQMKKLVIQQLIVSPSFGSTTPATRSSDIHLVKTKTLKVPEQPKENKKVKGDKGGGGNNKKSNKNDEGAKDEKRKVKFPCKLCNDDHLSHQFLQMEESQRLIKLNQQQQPIVLKNPFPQVQNLQVGSSNFNP